MTRKYTAADFANARFAEHPTGSVAARLYPEHIDPWFGGDDCAYTAQVLADTGWVPVPTKPTLTDSEVGGIAQGQTDDWLMGFIDGYEKAGGEIIPDPEPTNTDMLEELIIGAPGNFEGVEAILKRPASVRAWAEYLNDHGVTAPL